MYGDKRAEVPEVPEKATTNTANQAMGLMGGVGCGQSGRAVLLERATSLRREAASLEALANAIPDNFPRDADEGLWNLAIRNR